MRIAVHDYSGHPFQVQLSRALAGRGHAVRHLHCPAYTGGKGALARTPEDPSGFEVTAVELGTTFAKYSVLRRPLQELRYGRRLVARVREFRPDVLVSANTPLLAQWVLQRGCRRAGVPVVFWQQDVYSVAMGARLRRIPLAGGLAARAFESLERRLLRASAAVVVISPDFLPIVAAWGVDPRRTHVIENWAPIAELPLRPRDNPVARAHGLAGRPVVLYSGTLGLKHNPELLAALGRHFADRDVAVVVVSEGLGADWLRERSGGDLLQLPFQPYAELPDLLAGADVLVVILEPEAGVFSVPSKVLTYLCAGRPILAAVPEQNLAARLIAGSGAGVTVAPDDVAGFVLQCDALLADEDRRREMGAAARRYAEATFDLTSICDRFERIIRNARIGRPE